MLRMTEQNASRFCPYPFRRLVASVQAEQTFHGLLLLWLPSEADSELTVTRDEKGFAFRQTCTQFVEVRQKLVVRGGGSRQGRTAGDKQVFQVAN